MSNGARKTTINDMTKSRQHGCKEEERASTSGGEEAAKGEKPARRWSTVAGRRGARETSDGWRLNVGGCHSCDMC